MKPRTYFTPQRIARIAILSAIASLLFLIEIPVIGFYKLDVSNLPVLLGGFSMGPLAGTLILAIKSLVGLTHSGSGGVGELADFLLGAAMMLPAVLIYNRNKSRKTALIGMGVGTLCMTVAGILANLYLLIPFYITVMNFTTDIIVGIFSAIFPFIDSLPKVLLLATGPFNLLKGIVLSILTYVLYRHLSPLLHGRGIRS